LFVEYQLLAQKMRPGSPVLMAAYGDYGPGYIGTMLSYGEGGYETGPVSRVGPGVEEVLTRSLRELLKRISRDRRRASLLPSPSGTGRWHPAAGWPCKPTLGLRPQRPSLARPRSVRWPARRLASIG